MEQHLKDLQDRIGKVRELLKEINAFVASGEVYEQHGQANVSEAEVLISNAREALRVKCLPSLTNNFIHALLLSQ